MTFSRPSPYFIRGVCLALCIFLIDQLSKYLLVDRLSGGEVIEVLPFFKLVMVWNYGISFGLFADGGDLRKFLLVGVAAVITLCMLIWLWRARSWLLTFALAFIIGGAVGNVVDRFRWGAVADFFYFHYESWYWPAFNIADSGIFIGVVLLCWESIVNPDKTVAQEKVGGKDDIES